jgi:hypothetical protein
VKNTRPAGLELLKGRKMVRLSCPKSITEDRVVLPHQTLFECYDELNLAPFQGDSPGWMRSRG